MIGIMPDLLQMAHIFRSTTHYSIKIKSLGVTKQSITVQKEKITVLSDNIVLLTTCGETKIDVNNGNSFFVKFYWSFVYQKFDNNWKVIQSHQSSVR